MTLKPLLSSTALCRVDFSWNPSTELNQARLKSDGHLTKMCSGSEAGSYLRPKDLLGPVTRVKKKRSWARLAKHDTGVPRS